MLGQSAEGIQVCACGESAAEQLRGLTESSDSLRPCNLYINALIHHSFRASSVSLPDLMNQSPDCTAPKRQ
jgi:hypothetical protein